MTKASITSIAVILSLLAGTAAYAKVSVYLKDGGEIEAQKAWREESTVQVLVNRDTLLDLDESEVDLQKSKLKMKPQKKLLDQVIQLSGTRKQLENMLTSSSTDDDFDKVLLETYTPARAEKVVRRHLSKLGEKNLAKVLEWLRSPLGRKISDTEAVSDNPDRKKKMKEFLDQEATPATIERMQLLLEMERSLGLSELQIRLGNRMARRVAKFVPADFPDRPVLMEKIYSNVPSLETLRKQNAAKSGFTLRDFSLDELRAYQRFLDSPAGKKYNASTLDAAGEVLGTVMEKLGDNLGKAVVASRDAEPAAESAQDICSSSSREVSKKLPVKVDAVTTATGIFCESTTLEYQFQIKTDTPSELKATLIDKESMVRSKVCGQAELVETHLKKGISVKYSYSDGSGKLLHSILVTPSDCGV